MQESVNTYIKFIPFSNFNLWDVKRYYNKTNLKFENVVTLSDILIPCRKPVTKAEMIKNKWQIISKINFGGELFLRDFEEVNTYKGNLNLVPDNAIIYSKINVRHGCIYYHEKGKTPFCVSSEYPTYTFDENKISGKFLHKILRSDAFKKLLNTKTSGISKARVKQDEFLDIEIPLPSIFEQENIINAYLQKIEQAKKTKREIGTLEEEIEKYLFDALGYKIKPSTASKKKGNYLRVIDYSVIDKWGADQNNSKEFILTKSFEIKKIKDICTVSSGGTPSRDRKEYYTGNIPWIKTGEVVNDVIYDTEEKITKEAIENSSAKIYPKGSLIIAMYGQGLTRGRTAKLGIDASTNQACAVLFNINNKIILTDFLWIYLMGEYNRLRELASGNNQPNLNARMIKDYNVIIPPISTQEEIIKKYIFLKSKVKLIEDEFEKLTSIAELEFEKQIFG
ncbi:MAG: restriction endonuclease subunit S [Bacteroidetes bacterium]|nr:restriction endonuclease subunit S [Bacteroidota bacterium]